MSSHAPVLGQVVTIDIPAGRKVRHPITASPHKPGDRVTWSPYYRRRLNDGDLSVSAPSTSSTAKTAKAKE